MKSILFSFVLVLVSFDSTLAQCVYEGFHYEDSTYSPPEAGDTPGFGDAVASVDLNRDGINDVVVGAIKGLDDVGVETGKVSIFLSTGSRYDQVVDVATGTDVISIFGKLEFDGFGFGVADAGDLNGDGFNDLLISAYKADGKNGEVYVIFAADTWDSTYDIETLATGSTGVTISTTQTNVAGDRLGNAIAGDGDFNGDGNADIAIGAIHADTNRIGAVYVLFGPITSDVDVTTLDGTNGFAITDGATSSQGFGSSLTFVMFDSDVFSDLAIGSNLISHGQDTTGGAYILYGADTSYTSINIGAGQDPTQGGSVNTWTVIAGTESGTQYGESLAAGDVDDDGNGDILIGAYQQQAFLVFGDNDRNLEITLEAGDATALVRFDTNPTSADKERIVVDLGADVNNDGYIEVVICDNLIDGTSGVSVANSGACFVVFGDITLDASYDLSALDGTTGFIVTGDLESGNLGSSVASGDLNADGFEDLIIGAEADGDDGFGRVHTIWSTQDYLYEANTYCPSEICIPSTTPSPSVSPSVSSSMIPSTSSTVTSSASMSTSMTSSSSSTVSVTPSSTATVSSSATTSPTPSTSPSTSSTPSTSPSITSSVSISSTVSQTPSTSSSNTPTSSITPTASLTPSTSSSISLSPSTSPSNTQTSSISPSNTQTSSTSPSTTQTSSTSPSTTPTPSTSPSTTPTPSTSASTSTSPSTSASTSASPSTSASTSVTPSSSRSPSSSSSPSSSATATASTSMTPSPSVTPSPSPWVECWYGDAQAALLEEAIYGVGSNIGDVKECLVFDGDDDMIDYGYTAMDADGNDVCCLRRGMLSAEGQCTYGCNSTTAVDDFISESLDYGAECLTICSQFGLVESCPEIMEYSTSLTETLPMLSPRPEFKSCLTDSGDMAGWEVDSEIGTLCCGYTGEVMDDTCYWGCDQRFWSPSFVYNAYGSCLAGCFEAVPQVYI